MVDLVVSVLLLDLMILRVFSNLNDIMILQFYVIFHQKYSVKEKTLTCSN